LTKENLSSCFAQSNKPVREETRNLLVDRFAAGNDEGVDVLLETLDAGKFLRRSLESLYAEAPVARLLVCDGGSKDNTIETLGEFPRVELHVRPDIRTTGKALEFLISLAKTEWVMITDSDLTFPPGWYDEMAKYCSKYDAFDSRRIHAYEFQREDPTTANLQLRPLVGSPQMGRRKALEGFKVADDYMWRNTDIAMRQAVEKAGYRYGKVTTTFHYHHSSDEIRYASDPSKAATKLVFKAPKEIVINTESFHRRLINTAKSYVKYIDPEMEYVRRETGIDTLLVQLDRQWVAENGPRWLKRYDEAVKRKRMRVFRNIIRHIDRFLHSFDEEIHRRFGTVPP
jgi:glycosyltransferase involved in cell wall biosynthesis